MASQDGLDEKTSLLSSSQGITKMFPSTDTQDLGKENLRMTLRGRSSPTALPIEADILDLRQRLTIRQYLHSRLATVSDVMSSLAILSIALMILSNELTFVRENNAPTKASWWINLLNTFITIILLGLIIYYQYYSLKLFANHNSFEDPRIGLTIGKIISILVELIICAIHPIPRTYPRINPPMLDPTVTDEYDLYYMPTNIALSLPMFLRLYLVSRSIMYHSDLVRNSSMRSFGYMNKVTINFYFLFKTYLDIWATRSLLVICIVWLIVGSWSLRACDYYANQHITVFDAVWLFVCTLAAIGYGEIYPTTYCGRTIAGVVGLSGLLISALLITVLEQKCSLTRQENYVHTFVMSSELANDLKDSAANVVKYSVKLWYLRKKNSRNYLHRLRVQQRIFAEINILKALKIEKRILADNYAGIEEIMTLQQRMVTQSEGSQQKTIKMENNVMQMSAKLDTIEHQMTTLQSSMNTLLDQMKKQTFV